MSPRDSVYVGHMLDMARKAVAKTRGVTRDIYERDENLRLALTHLVQVIGEAARRASREFYDEHPEIPWQDIVGMRHKVVHDYLGVDDDIVWQVVTVRTCRAGNRQVGRSTGSDVAVLCRTTWWLDRRSHSSQDFLGMSDAVPEKQLHDSRRVTPGEIVRGQIHLLETPVHHHGHQMAV